MKTLLTVNMYSGMCHLDPNVYLDEKQTSKLIELAQSCKQVRGAVNYNLGPHSFSVSFTVLFDPLQYGWPHVYAETDYPEIIHLYSTPGSVGIWYRDDPQYSDMKWFKDDQGIHEMLRELVRPAMEKHADKTFEEVEASWAHYYRY
jgi:hypothetical protein